MPSDTAPTTPTRQVRIAGDLVEKITVLAWYADTSSADIVDPLIRSTIDKRFNALPEAVQKRALDRIASIAASAD